MDPQDISSRLHDILRDACRVRLPGPGCTAEASIDSVNAVKLGLRTLLADLDGREPSRLPPRVKAAAAALPEGRIPGTRILVQHRRRTRGMPEAGAPHRSVVSRTGGRPSAPARMPDVRTIAEAHFRLPTDTANPLQA